MFHLSSGYTTDDSGTRYVFTWNRKKIPNPQQMIQNFHDAGMRTAPNIKPYLLKTHPFYNEVANQSGFVKDGDSDAPALSDFWSGGAFQSGEGSYVDFTSTAGYNWWKSRATEVLLNIGIDSLWNDNNEFEIWDDAARCNGFGREIPISLARPLQTLLMGRASYEALREFAPDKRPFVLSRSGCPGIQRYAQTWSGDNETSWHTLRYNIPMGLGMSLSGAPNTGHDIGGFFGPAPDAELFIRWVQNGIFHPRFTIHSWNTDGTVNEPWMHPDALPIIRETIRFRYRLLPYLYSLLFESHKTGHPIIRPLVYHFPDDPRCHTESFDFMLGANLLVASILEPNARTRQVYLPMGNWWCNFHTGEWYEGGQIVEVAAPLERIPLFVPAGGIIPTGKLMRYVGEQPDDERHIYVFPRVGHSTFTLIEDDGESIAYQRGEFTEVILEMVAETNAITLSAHKRHNGYRLPYDSVEFILPPHEIRPVIGRNITTAKTDEQGHQRITVVVE
jgi:alpha-glucosidase